MFHLSNLVAGESCRWFAADARNARKTDVPKTDFPKTELQIELPIAGWLYLVESYENDQRAVNAIRDPRNTIAGSIESRDIPLREPPHRDMMAACTILTANRWSR
ncbi:MAG: hypothetical protein WCA64_12525 [Gallionella sp.]